MHKVLKTFILFLLIASFCTTSIFALDSTKIEIKLPTTCEFKEANLKIKFKNEKYELSSPKWSFYAETQVFDEESGEGYFAFSEIKSIYGDIISVLATPKTEDYIPHIAAIKAEITDVVTGQKYDAEVIYDKSFYSGAIVEDDIEKEEPEEVEPEVITPISTSTDVVAKKPINYKKLFKKILRTIRKNRQYIYYAIATIAIGLAGYFAYKYRQTLKKQSEVVYKKSLAYYQKAKPKAIKAYNSARDYLAKFKKKKEPKPEQNAEPIVEQKPQEKIIETKPADKTEQKPVKKAKEEDTAKKIYLATAAFVGVSLLFIKKRKK